MKKAAPVAPVLGHDLPRARLTPRAWAWIGLFLGVPVLLLGSVLDGLYGLITGQCSGWWCLWS